MNFEEQGIALITANVTALVDNPDSVQVKAISGQSSTVFEVIVAKSDVGQVIGKSGKTAAAIRRILHSFAIKSKHTASMEIVE